MRGFTRDRVSPQQCPGGDHRQRRERHPKESDFMGDRGTVEAGGRGKGGQDGGSQR